MSSHFIHSRISLTLAAVFIFSISLALVPSVARAASVNSLEKGLVGHWSLDGITKAKDLTPNGNNGTGQGGINIGTTTDQHNQANRATNFVSASSQYVSLGNISIPSAITVSAWVYSTNFTQSGMLIEKDSVNQNWELFLENGLGNEGSAGLKWRSGSATGIVTSFPNNSIWHHIVATQIGTTGAIYVDGVSVVTGNISVLGNNIGNINIGRYNSSYYFNGSISDVRIYSRALSAAEVKQLYNSYRPAVSVGNLEKGLVGHWSLDGITKAKDLTPNGNNGTGQGTLASTFIGTSTDQHLQANRATTFNGTNNYIALGAKVVPHGASAWTNFSASAWLYPTTSTGYRAWLGDYVVSSGSSGTKGNFLLRADNGGTSITLIVWDGNNTTPKYVSFSYTMPLNTWTNVIVVSQSNGSTISFYANGVSIFSGSSSASSFSDANTYNAQIGSVNGYYWKGSISDARLYSRALSAAEVLQLYNSYRPAMSTGNLEKGLVGRWALDGITKAKDLTPNGNNGTGQGGINIGTTTDQHSQANRATSFNGSANYITVTNNPLKAVNASSMSFSSWVYINSSAFSGPLGLGIIADDSGGNPGANKGFYVSLDNRGGAQSPLKGLQVVISTLAGSYYGMKTNDNVFSSTGWYFITITYANGVGHIYVNGTDNTVVWNSGSGAFRPTTAKMNLGVENDGVSYFLNGNLSDARIYNRALSAAEVLQLYNSYRL